MELCRRDIKAQSERAACTAQQKTAAQAAIASWSGIQDKQKQLSRTLAKAEYDLVLLRLDEKHAQVRCRCVSEAASLSPAMTSVTIAAAVVVVIVGVVVAGVIIIVKIPNSCSIQTSKGSAIKASDKTRPCIVRLYLSSDSESL